MWNTPKDSAEYGCFRLSGPGGMGYRKNGCLYKGLKNDSQALFATHTQEEGEGNMSPSPVRPVRWLTAGLITLTLTACGGGGGSGGTLDNE